MNAKNAYWSETKGRKRA